MLLQSVGQADWKKHAREMHSHCLQPPSWRIPKPSRRGGAHCNSDSLFNDLID